MDFVKSHADKFKDYVFTAFISLYIIISPFFRGLFFRENYLWAIMIAAILFIGFTILYYKNGIFKSINIIDVTFLLFTLSYTLSFFFGVSKMDSFDGALKAIALYLIYSIIKEISRKECNSKLLINAFILSGFAVALCSMLGAAEIIKIPGVFAWEYRLMGVYQYPNATASVLGALIMLTIVYMLDKENVLISMLYQISLSTMFIAFLLTRSRGGILSLAIALAAAFFLIKGQQKLIYLINFVFTLLISAGFYNLVLNSLISKKGFITSYICFIAINTLTGVALLYIKKLLYGLSKKATNVIIAAIMLSILTLGVISMNITEPLKLSANVMEKNYEIYNVLQNKAYKLEVKGLPKSGYSTVSIDVISIDKAKVKTTLASFNYEATKEKDKEQYFKTLQNTQYITIQIKKLESDSSAEITSIKLFDTDSQKLVKNVKLKYKFIPDNVAKRINEINLKTENSSERIIFIKDGLSILKDYPIFGAGAGGWKNLYMKYQSYEYSSSEAHNYYLQTAIEVGAFGFILLALTLISIIYTAAKLYKNQSMDKIRLTALLSMLLALFGHALIDFEFSYFAVGIIVWGGIGILSGMNAENNGNLSYFNPFLKIKYLLILLSVAVLFISANICYAASKGYEAANAYNDDREKSMKLYEKIINKDFFNSDYFMDYSKLLVIKGIETKNKEFIEEAYKNYKKVERNEPYKVKYYSSIIPFYLKYGHIDEASNLLERLTEINPITPASYEYKAKIYSEILSGYIKIGKNDLAKKYAEKIIDIERQYNEIKSRTISSSELTDTTKLIISVVKETKTKLDATQESK